MTRSEFHCLAPGAPLYLWSGKAQHAATSKAIEVLREALGDEADAVIAGAWRLRARVTAARKACKHGSYLELASAVRDDVVVAVHLRDVVIETREEHAARVKIAVVRFDRAQAQRAKLRLVDAPPTSAGPTAPEPARCDPPARTPWADNKRVGSIYVEREPSRHLPGLPRLGRRRREAATDPVEHGSARGRARRGDRPVREAARVDRRSRSRSRRGGGRMLKGSCPSVTCGQGKGSALPSAGGPAQPEAALRRRCVSTSTRSTRSSMSGPRRPTYLRALARRAWWSRLRVLRAALLVHEAPEPRLLARRIRDLGPKAWLARQIDALLRRGDRWAADVERALKTELGPLLTGSTNPADEWRGATGRLRRIGPGAEGLRLRRVELEAEARAAGYDLQLQVRRRGRDAVVRSGPAPESQ